MSRLEKRMTVLSVAYPLAPAGPDAVGGAEQMLSALDRALVRSGHRSIVVAQDGSTVAGTLMPTPAPARGVPLDDTVKERVQAEHLRQIERALRRWPIDVIHMHGIDFHRYLPPAGVPTLVTLHLPPSWYPESVFRLQRPRTYLHCVSASQERSCPPWTQGLLPHIDNGVPVADLAAGSDARRGGAPRRFALALGRICPEKNFQVALDAGKRADVPVLLAGEVFAYPEHQEYFRREIVPRLDRWRRFIGPVGFARKRRLLSAAKCLLLPTLAPETSSLVAREALACGTPVIAYPSGALPEAIEHGRTGFLVNGAEEMADAIRHVDAIDPDVCRRIARERFDIQDMLAAYFRVYERLAAEGRTARCDAHVHPELEDDEVVLHAEKERLPHGA